jgi:hypothetical protein
LSCGGEWAPARGARCPRRQGRSRRRGGAEGRSAITTARRRRQRARRAAPAPMRSAGRAVTQLRPFVNRARRRLVERNGCEPPRRASPSVALRLQATCQGRLRCTAFAPVEIHPLVGVRAWGSRRGERSSGGRFALPLIRISLLLRRRPTAGALVLFPRMRRLARRPSYNRNGRHAAATPVRSARDPA